MLGGQLEVLPPRLEIAFVRRRRGRVGQRRLRRRAALVRIRIARRHGRRAGARRTGGLERGSAARVKIQWAERLDEAPDCPGGRGGATSDAAPEGERARGGKSESARQRPKQPGSAAGGRIEGPRRKRESTISRRDAQSERKGGRMRG